MSIINQMLKDIDKREQQPDGGKRAASMYAGKPVRSRAWLWALLGVLVVILIYAAVVLGSRLLNNETPLPSAEQLQIQRQPLTSTAQPVTTQPEATAAVAPEYVAPERARPVAQPVLAQPTTNAVADSEASAETSAAANAGAEQTHTYSRVVDPRIGNPRASVQPGEAANSSAAESQAAVAEPEPSAEPSAEPEPANEMSVQRSNTTDSAASLYRRGMEAAEAGNVRQAIQRLQEALLLNPNHHEARLQLAALQFGRGFSGDALALLQEGVQRAPSFHAFILLKARIYERIGQPDYALQLVRGVTAVLPEDADLLLLRANLASDNGHYALAVNSYQALVQWRPQQGNWWLAYGFALQQLAAKQTPADAEYEDYLQRAAEAYRQALRDPSLSATGQRFAQQQREALGY